MAQESRAHRACHTIGFCWRRISSDASLCHWSFSWHTSSMSCEGQICALSQMQLGIFMNLWAESRCGYFGLRMHLFFMWVMLFCLLDQTMTSSAHWDGLWELRSELPNLRSGYSTRKCWIAPFNFWVSPARSEGLHLSLGLVQKWEYGMGLTGRLVPCQQESRCTGLLRWLYSWAWRECFRFTSWSLFQPSPIDISFL